MTTQPTRGDETAEIKNEMTMTKYKRAAFGRIRNALDRYRNLPGYSDDFELGDLTILHRAIDPDAEPTRAGRPIRDDAYPVGSVVVSVDDLQHMVDWVECYAIPRSGSLGAQTVARIREAIGYRR